MATRGARAGIVALGLVGFVVAAFGVSNGPPVVRRSAQAVFTFDRPGINDHNSPAVAADPARPFTVALADRIDTPLFSCSVSVSSDFGSHWAPVEVPLPPGVENCFWPDVGYDAGGRLLVLYTTTGGRYNLPVGVWLQRFAGTAPDGPAVRVAGSEAFQAHMGVHGNDVLVAYVQATPDTAGKGLGFGAGPNPVTAVRSHDGGRTFSEPVAVSEPARRVVAPDVVLGPGGAALVVALDLGDDTADYEATHGGQGGPPDGGRWAVVAYRSHDGGAAFSPVATVARNLVIPQRIVVNLPPVPGLARDPATGRLYVAWDAGRGDRRDVFVASSDDGGASWTAPVAVGGGRGTQSLPALGVAPDGRVDVLFYDRSRDPEDRRTEVQVASSWDEGETFHAGTVSTRDFDARLGYNSLQGVPILSSQLAVLSGPGRALAFWADTRGATQDDNAVRLAEAVVEARRTGDRNWPAAVVGFAVLALAVRLGWQP